MTEKCFSTSYEAINADAFAKVLSPVTLAEAVVRNALNFLDSRLHGNDVKRRFPGFLRIHQHWKVHRKNTEDGID